PRGSVQPGSSGDDLSGNPELLEILHKQFRQLAGLGVVGVGIRPGGAGVEVAAADAWYRRGVGQIEDGQGFGSGVLQGSAGDGGNHRPGHRDGKALAVGAGAAGPAGVHQVDSAAEVVDALHQQLGVDPGGAGHEGGAKTGGEGGGDAGLAPQLGGTHPGGV